MSKIDNEAFEWVARKFSRGLGDAESVEFDAWHAADVRHKGAYGRAMAIHNAISLATAPQSLSTKKAFTSRRRLFIAGAMAACLAATVGTVSFSVLRADKVLTTAKGEFRKVPLQDKSIATINSASRLEVAFTKDSRNVKLRFDTRVMEKAKTGQLLQN